MRSIQFFRDLSTEDLDKLAAIASRRNVRAGDVLYHEGAKSEKLHVILSGLVALDMCMPRQGCTRILTVGPGELLGWSTLLSDGTMTVRATAVEKTELVEFPGQTLRRLCDEDHDIGYAVMREVAVALSRRLLATRLQMLDILRETQPVERPENGPDISR